VPGVDQYDIIAVIVGVMFTMRKLDTQSRSPAQSPNVDPEDFLRWQRRSAAAYAPGAYASFFRVIFHFGFLRYSAHHQLPPLTFARVALLVDALWLVCTVYTLINAHFAREMRKKLGISLDKPQATR
jgi:hypothetical protein